MTLEIREGCFSYGGQPVLDHVSLTAGPGDLIAVLGPNGAGKTTMLRCMLGFLHWQSGDSFLDGRSVRSIPPRELWRSIAYVPQARSFTSAATAEQTVLLGRNAHIGLFSQPKKKDIDLVHELLDRLHISHLAQKSCAGISGGELQMVLIARALAAEPKILVLDEPESNLDFRNQLIVLETMTDLTRQGMTVIFNTHYPDHALRRANKALLLHKGGQAQFGDTHSIVTEEHIRNAFQVRTVIGEIETDERIYRSILPLDLAAETAEIAPDTHRIATVSMILQDGEQAMQVNEILHEYSQYLVGRMGLPYRKAGVHIINVTLDAPQSEILALTEKLGRLSGCSVKATYAVGFQPT
ncbi:MAG: ATP-binding cassette domain-containing protein [Oscillospiraceae bacterium]|nr:ATP-binding cassette domain-containing protein [Oscillospiraceae bacterium]